MVNRAKLFGENLLDAVGVQVEPGDVPVGVGMLDRFEGDVLADHHVDAGRIGVAEDRTIVDADVDVVSRVVLLLGLVMLLNRELDSGAVGDCIEQAPQLALRPLILSRDAEVEVFAESSRPRKIQLAQCGAPLEPEVET